MTKMSNDASGIAFVIGIRIPIIYIKSNNGGINYKIYYNFTSIKGSLRSKSSGSTEFKNMVGSGYA